MLARGLGLATRSAAGLAATTCSVASASTTPVRSSAENVSVYSPACVSSSPENVACPPTASASVTPITGTSPEPPVRLTPTAAAEVAALVQPAGEHERSCTTISCVPADTVAGSAGTTTSILLTAAEISKASDTASRAQPGSESVHALARSVIQSTYSNTLSVEKRATPPSTTTVTSPPSVTTLSRQHPHGVSSQSRADSTVIVTEPSKLTTTLPKRSSKRTTGWRPNGSPAMPSAGCVENSSCDATASTSTGAVSTATPSVQNRSWYPNPATGSTSFLNATVLPEATTATSPCSACEACPWTTVTCSGTSGR
mmetsp:Transcript_51861/g.105579  ORF Transcript_51861/g.105579 Transcript_51861/m.105579 type:complete len:313 (-) Transcript_51861:487-1425(-)